MAFRVGRRPVEQTLKNAAEAYFRKNFPTAVVIVPWWLCSTPRLILKNGAFIAGFTGGVHVLNHETLAACSFVSDVDVGCDIVVLSEIGGVTTGTLYHWDKNVLRMISDDIRRYENGATNQSQAVVAVSMTNFLFSKINHDYEASTPKAVICLTKSMEVFEKIEEIDPEWRVRHSGEVFKDTTLSREKLDEVKRKIVDLFPTEFSRNRPPPQTTVAPILAAKLPLPLDDYSCQLSFKLFRRMEKIHFLQEHYLRPGERVLVAELALNLEQFNAVEIQEGRFSYCSLAVFFDVTKEGIIIRKDFEFLSFGEPQHDNNIGNDIKQRERPPDLIWRTPTLDGNDEKMEEFKRYIQWLLGVEPRTDGR